jgi:hypothetical protein
MARTVRSTSIGELVAGGSRSIRSYFIGGRRRGAFFGTNEFNADFIATIATRHIGRQKSGSRACVSTVLDAFCDDGRRRRRRCPAGLGWRPRNASRFTAARSKRREPG